jgi:transcriptional regulator with XRE-family HTH domain
MTIGAALAEARQEAGLTVADVSARTRIRQVLIEAIEQDEFDSCGGDFYARGHIRAIAAAVGADPRPLITEYDAAHTSSSQAIHPAARAAQPTVKSARPTAKTNPPVGRTTQPAQAARDDLLDPPPPGTPHGRRRYGWLVPVAMTLCLVAVVFVAFRLTSGPGGSQSPSAARSPNRTVARTPTGSASARSSPRGHAASSAAAPPSSSAGTAVTDMTPVSATAVGPGGTSDGDNPQNASLALSGNPATPWQTDWYASAQFGNLQAGTGLLLDLGQTVTATGVTIQLGSTPGATLQVRAGTNSADLPVVANATDAGGAVRLSLASRPRVRYVLIWFTLLPPDASGTYQADVSGVTVAASSK